MNAGPQVGFATSEDGTLIRYRSVGAGPGLVVVGGVLSAGDDYLPLAGALAGDFRVLVIDRRGRAGSGPQREQHSIADECCDLRAVLVATNSAQVFGHSMGGLIALELARMGSPLERLHLYEPGVPIRGLLRADWLAGYERRLRDGDRRGAFAWMVKQNGFAPPALTRMPLWWVRMILRLVVRSEQWSVIDRHLEANLVEHRAQGALDAVDAERYSTVVAPTVLYAGAKSPPFMQQIVAGLAEHIPTASVRLLEGLDHLAPQHHPGRVAAAIARER